MAAGHVSAYALYRLGFQNVAIGRVNEAANETWFNYGQFISYLQEDNN